MQVNKRILKLRPLWNKVHVIMMVEIILKFWSQIKLAGLRAFLKKIKPRDENCTSFRAEAKLLMTDDVLRNPGGLVKFVVPYCNGDGNEVGEVTQDDIEYDPNYRVYNRKYYTVNATKFIYYNNYHKWIGDLDKV